MTKDPQKHLYELLSGFSTAMLVSHENNGTFHARPMAIAELKPDVEATFATDKRSPKISEIATNPNVLITFQSASEYAALEGVASLTADREEIDRLWSEAWRVWFPDGKDDPNLVLIKVRPTSGEYWDNSGLEGLKYVFKGIKAVIQGERPDTDETQHAKVALGR